MSYTWDDFYRDFAKEHIAKFPIEDRLQGLSINERIKDIPVTELLQKVLEQMSPAELEAYLRQRCEAGRN